MADSIVEIGSGVFSNCTNLKEVILSEKLLQISPYTFENCRSLKNICFPEKLSEIGEYSFSGCAGLESIIIPGNVKKIGSSAFKYCVGIKNITISEGVEWIGSKSFEHCAFEKIVIPDSVTYIGTLAFYANDKLLGVRLSANLTEIPEQVFYDCEGLKTVEIPFGVKSIASSAFERCLNLENLLIPDSMQSIGDNAFNNCDSLTEINIPDGVTQLGRGVFLGCSSLLKVKLPSSLQMIGVNAFSSNTVMLVYEGTYSHKYALENGCSCYVLTTEDEDVEFYVVNGIIYYVADNKAVVLMADKSLKEAVIEKEIEGYPVSEIKAAFQDNTVLTKVTIPDSVEKIGEFAFSGCTALTEVLIPESVTSIEASAFVNCKNLNEIALPDSVVSIGKAAFSYCSGLMSIKLPGNLKTIGDAAFHSCTRLTNIVLPESVEYLGKQAFDKCVELTDVTILSSLNTIEFATFRQCYKLKNIIIPEGVKVLDNAAFMYCCKLEKISLPYSLQILWGDVFYGCDSLVSIEIPEYVTQIGSGAFCSCDNLVEVKLSQNLKTIGSSAFSGCVNLENIIIPDSAESIGKYAFYNCKEIKMVKIPEAVTTLYTSSFPVNTILLVYENSYAHTFAVNNDLLYFVIRKTENPEINYGAGISGTVTDTNGNAVVSATVEAIYDDGTVKESVVTDENGAYVFTYAEVGRYTIRATDTNGNTASEAVSVKRMNVFDVFIAGETDIVLKTGYNVSGNIQPAGNATVTIKDIDGNVISIVETADGAFTFENISNGTYIITAENESGSASTEVTVYNSDVTVESLVIATESATITGYVEVEDRDFGHHRRNWVHVTLYNAEGVAIASQKTDKDGKYTFVNIPVGEYTIVAETSEMRPDKEHGYDRSHTLTGYAYMNVTEAIVYEAETIILYEENDHLAEISGKVTAHGETQDCEVVLKNVFRHEVARMTTGKNGKYTFKNVRDGLYIITATTKSDGMGLVIVVVRRGEIFGETDITVFKDSHIRNHEELMKKIPNCKDRDEALQYKDDIRREKEFYDGLSEKEKKQLSKEYIEKLNHNSELIANCSYESTEGLVENGGLIISEDELNNETSVKFVLNVEKKEAHIKSKNGVETDADYIQHSIEDTAKGKNIVQYYEISLTKNGKTITDVQKHTNSTGKIKITLDIPEEYRGHKHYSFVHVHNGETTTLVDLDDNPETVTFEVDRFSTFALSYTDEELTEVTEDSASISLSDDGKRIKVSSAVDATLYIATYDVENRLTKVESSVITAETADKLFDFNSNQAAFIMDSSLMPLCEKFIIK